MGTMIFLLPADLCPDAAHELERSWIAAGPYPNPWPTRAWVEGHRLHVQRAVEESGALVAPWRIAGAGQLMGGSGTLMERPEPYHFLLELARGKLTQVRSQAETWQQDGLGLPGEVLAGIQRAKHAFCQLVAQAVSHDLDAAAQDALQLAYQAADQLVHTATEQVLAVERQHPERRRTGWGCRIMTAPSSAAARALTRTFDSVTLIFPWRQLQPLADRYDWSLADALVDWADREALEVTGGPLLDLAPDRLPDWLRPEQRDLPRMAKLLSGYATALLKRYGQRLRRWQLGSTDLSAAPHSWTEQDLLGLTLHLGRVARAVNPDVELLLGVAQPWGDALAHGGREQSPFLFAETVARELGLSALDVELIMAVAPGGSYCRDLLEASRLLDCYAELGMPLRVTLGYPSAETADAKARPAAGMAAGSWRDGITESVQGEWAAAFATLALSKRTVAGIDWAQLSDASPHPFPHCGLLDAAENPKPVLAALQQLGETQLR